MNKRFKSYLIFWAVLLVLFNVIAFVSPGWIHLEKYTPSFWIGYVCITLAFAGQLACAHKALKEQEASKVFYGIPLLRASYAGLIASFFFGGGCMLLSPLPYWVSALVCAVVLALNVIAVMKATVVAEAVARVDEKTRTQTFFIKSLTVDAEGLMARADQEDMKGLCKKAYEAIRYSDPRSNEVLADLENRITEIFAALSKAVETRDLEAARRASGTLEILLNDRNKKCKLLK